MLNHLAKLMLVATSLAPILGAVAVNHLSNGKPWWYWGSWLMAGVLLTFICWGLLRHASDHGQQQTITVEDFESNDKEIVAFLLAYLLPFISSDNMTFEGDWLTGAYILLIIFLVVAHAGAFHFNPVMGLLGYHFYGVKTKDGVSQLLITKQPMKRPPTDVKTVLLSHNIYLATGD